jgi:hypothetical protein
MSRALLGLLFVLGMQACGVKAPPIAPEQPSAPAPAPRLDCSPQDETCDKTDPGYKRR